MHPDRKAKSRVARRGGGPRQRSKSPLNRVASRLVATRAVTYQLLEWRASNGFEALILWRSTVPNHLGPPDAGESFACLPLSASEIPRHDAHNDLTNLAGPGSVTTQEHLLPGH